MIFLQKFSRVSLRHLMPDAVLIVISLYLSLYLRVGGTVGMDRFLPILHVYLPIFIVVRLVTFTLLDVYLMMWRYVSTSDVVKLFKAVALSSAFVLALSVLIPGVEVLPRSIFFIDSVVLTVLLMGSRLIRRLVYEKKNNRHLPKNRTRALIIGAGSTGRILSQQFLSSANQNIDLLGFIDDDPKKLGKVIGGFKVLGNLEELPRIIQDSGVTQVVVAISVMPPKLLCKIFEITRPFNLIPKITTDLKSTTPVGQNSVDVFRKIHIGDLLQRPPREIDIDAVRDLIRGKRVLVTGAGGSIGSEISRQILTHEPNRLLLLDHSEYNLYNIDKELRLATHDVTRVVPLLLDIKDRKTLDYSLNEFAPEIVFHAAAYKHVHLVETNPSSAILNNIMGTLNLLEVCKELGVTHFVNVSTDKAVNPAGVMGASKRVSEILIALTALQTGHKYCSVRFGNVLGSSGSLIPTLTEQIQSGNPLTITHKEMTRYFMLIPEAVQLVLKASTIARPGDINVLKMGEPVKVLDLAHSLITLLGKSVDDIPIIFTGLRPGEKMFEELYIRGDELRTEHPDILTIPNGDLSPLPLEAERKKLKNQISEMISHAKTGDKEALILLSQLVRSNYTAKKGEFNDGDEVISNLISYNRNN